MLKFFDILELIFQYSTTKYIMKVLIVFIYGFMENLLHEMIILELIYFLKPMK
jgi:hypothetical protein